MVRLGNLLPIYFNEFILFYGNIKEFMLYYALGSQMLDNNSSVTFFRVILSAYDLFL